MFLGVFVAPQAVIASPLPVLPPPPLLLFLLSTFVSTLLCLITLSLALWT
jgi:hypothetical protein